LASSEQSAASPSGGLFDRINGIWGIVCIVASVVTTLITATLYVDSLLRRIDLLEKQVASINDALSFGKGFERKSGVVFNGDEGVPLCPDGSVMRGIRFNGDMPNGNPHGSIDCVNLKPQPIVSNAHH
jgi:hypothetical protein